MSAPALGTLLPRLSGPVPGPASRALARRLREVESRDVTFMGPDFPVFWEAARGANVLDADGNVLLDFTGAFGVSFAGHAHPRVVGRVREQAGRLLHGMGDVHPPALKVELLERLAVLSPWSDTRTALAGSGSEAVEIALKTGLLATDRPGILAFEGAYHGLTLGSLAATHRSHFRGPFEGRLFRGVRFVPFPGRDGADAALDAVEGALAVGAPDGSPIGTVVVEPVQGRAGVRIPPEGFMHDLVRLARERGCVVVMDEVFTGFGRTGALFASVEMGAVPDLLCVGKALGGGLPLSACMGAEGIMDAWPESGGEAVHTSTFLGHPLAAAASLGFLDAVAEDDLVRRARTTGHRMLEHLRSELDGLEGVADVRGTGLMLAVELRDPDGAPLVGGGERVAVGALGRGLLVLPAGGAGHVVELAPPAVVTDEQAAWGVEALAAAVRDALGTSPGDAAIPGAAAG